MALTADKFCYYVMDNGSISQTVVGVLDEDGELCAILPAEDAEEYRARRFAVVVTPRMRRDWFMRDAAAIRR